MENQGKLRAGDDLDRYLENTKLQSRIIPSPEEMALSSLIHFEGDWPAEERTRIAAAAGVVEATGPARPDGPGAPWIVIQQDTGAETIYVASRLGETDVLTGRSAAGLADRIRRCA